LIRFDWAGLTRDWKSLDFANIFLFFFYLRSPSFTFIDLD